MERMTPPQVPDQPVDVLTEDQVKALLDDCKGRSFVAIRDTAIIRGMIDTGIRRAELLGMTVEDVDFDQDRARKRAVSRARSAGSGAVIWCRCRASPR
jgi:integrase